MIYIILLAQLAITLLALHELVIKRRRVAAGGLWLLVTIAPFWNFTPSAGGVYRVMAAGALLAAYIAGRRVPRRWMQGVALGLIMLVMVDIFVSGGRPHAFLNFTEYAASLVLVLPYLSHLVLVGLALAAIAITLTRSAVISLAAAWCISQFDRWRLNVWARGGILLAALAAAAASIILRPGTVTFRVAEWQTALDLFASAPWLGVGSGAWLEISGGYLHADNLPLTIAAESGLVGLLPWLLLAGWIVLVIRRNPPAFAVPMTAMFMVQLLDAPILLQLPAMLFGICLGQMEHEVLPLELARSWLMKGRWAHAAGH